MPEPARSFTRIAIAAHPQIKEAYQEAARISEFLEQQGIYSIYRLLYNEELTQRVKAKEFDLLIALGGDGTMLRAGHLCGPAGIPILGINMGRLGFLIEIRKDQWQASLERLLGGDFWLEKRMMLCAEQWHGDNQLGRWDVVNEAVVGRGWIVRPVQLTAEVDGRYLTTYVADALIASTPTGSTAYALAAGGPVLPPELRAFTIVPAAPHLTMDRAIVLPEGSTVSITVHTEHRAILCIDGQAPIDLEDGDFVRTYANEHSLKFVRFQDPGYFYRNLTQHMNQNPLTGNSR